MTFSKGFVLGKDDMPSEYHNNVSEGRSVYKGWLWELRHLPFVKMRVWVAVERAV